MILLATLALALTPQVDPTVPDVLVSPPDAVVSGTLKVWHPIELEWPGPSHAEDDGDFSAFWYDDPNPFLDYRLQVTLTHTDGTTYVCQGFFDGDGNGGGTGNKWKVRFNPDRSGDWTYLVDFRMGANVAVSMSPTYGGKTNFHGSTNTFTVGAADTTAPGLLAQGRLEYVGKKYLKQRDSSTYWLKTGSNSPENLFGYSGFDNVVDQGGLPQGIIHDYAPHIVHWGVGDPDWGTNDGKGIIGLLNYLGTEYLENATPQVALANGDYSQGLNSVFFLPHTLGGDGQETTPLIGYTDDSDNDTHYDISRLEQWNTVLNHAQTQGILVTFVLAEEEVPNYTWFDGGAVGVERKLFFRELSARFGYLNGVKWTLSEESKFSYSQHIQMAEYMDYVDPYDHITAVHNEPNNWLIYAGNLNSGGSQPPIAGNPLFDAASVQYHFDTANVATEVVGRIADANGRTWVLDMDENGLADTGVHPGGTQGSPPETYAPNMGQARQTILYDVLFSGGNIEWYFGNWVESVGGDHTVEDWTTREDLWLYTRIARDIMTGVHPQTGAPLSYSGVGGQGVPNAEFWNMRPADTVITNPQTHPGLGNPEVYLRDNEEAFIYIPSNATSPFILDMTDLQGVYKPRWWNPRTGAFVGGGAFLDSSPGGNKTLTQLGQAGTIDGPVDYVVYLEKQP